MTNQEMIDLCKRESAEFFLYLMNYDDGFPCNSDQFLYFEDEDHSFKSTFMYLGEGYFSRVYLHLASGLAIKFGGFKNGLDAYPSYVELCAKLQGNKHVPTIHEYHKEFDFYYCITDRYYPAMCSDYHMDLRYCIESNHPETREQYGDDAADLAEALRETGEAMDLHSENVMQDGNGILIVTDPYSFC